MDASNVSMDHYIAYCALGPIMRGAQNIRNRRPHCLRPCVTFGRGPGSPISVYSRSIRKKKGAQRHSGRNLFYTEHFFYVETQFLSE